MLEIQWISTQKTKVFIPDAAKGCAPLVSVNGAEPRSKAVCTADAPGQQNVLVSSDLEGGFYAAVTKAPRCYSWQYLASSASPTNDRHVLRAIELLSPRSREGPAAEKEDGQQDSPCSTAMIYDSKVKGSVSAHF